MKRSGTLSRRKPLRAQKGLAPGKPLRSTKFKPSRSEIRPRAPKTRKPEKSQYTDGKALPWELAHLAAVKALPCRVCGRGGINDAHHCYHDRGTKFGGRKAPHRWTIPLCRWCHLDGPEAIHKIKRTWRKKHGADWEHVPWVMMSIYGVWDPTDKQIERHWKSRGLI